MTDSSQLFSLLLLFLMSTTSTRSSSNDHEIQRGFTATPDPSLQFQPILTDPTSAFSFGFLRINSTQLDLAVLHLPSSFPLWRAIPNRPASWSPSTSLSFNGSLLLSGPETELFWSTNTANIGDKLILLNSSNLQVQKNEEPVPKILWQSFDSPSDTIVQDQNFTSKAALFSTNQQFSMSLGDNYIALYMAQLGPARPMYWKHTALQARAEIVPGEGPIYAQINQTGFLGLYQKENEPVDVLSFDTFNGGIKRSLRRLTLESDGNLRAYYWSGSAWASDFVAIASTCELPTPCGPYGLCHVEGQRCGGCVDNRTDGCFPAGSGDLCGSDGNGFRVLRKTGVDLANKELLGFQKVSSLEACEGLCEKNCSCWGAVYNNVSGYCYRMEYPIQTVLAVGEETKVGYFKVRNAEEVGSKKSERRRRAGMVLIVVGALVLAGGCGFVGYRVWNAKRWRRSGEDEAAMPYKDLNSSSFRSIELANLFRK